MTTQELTNWVQAFSGIALVIGIVLVTVELQQTKALTRAQLKHDSVALGIQREIAAMGENPLESLARSCTDPDSLSPYDLLVLDRYYQTGVLHVMRELQVEQTGGFDGERWKYIARSMFRQIFMTSHGKRWWEARSAG